MCRVASVLAVVAVLGLLVPTAFAQPGMAKPGPEHEKLKQMEGSWDATVKMMGKDSKASASYKMELGGFWLVGEFKGDFEGMAFTGKSFDSFDPASKKYQSVWLDSMSTIPMTMTGTMDKDGKKLTLAGDGMGHDGKPAKYKSVTEFKDKDTVVFTMYTVADNKDTEMMTITYKRKK